jgi:predicted lactoylglutathione lyase
MQNEFPAAVPEVPVAELDAAAAYYTEKLGFTLDWRSEHDGIAGISRGSCRIFLTDRGFREAYGNAAPIVVWINLNNRSEVDELYEAWRRSKAEIDAPPESKPWHLYEFTATDLDGNVLRVFYDFSWETREKQEPTEQTARVQ